MAQKHNKKFYLEAKNKFGISAQGVHWNSKYTQYKRFEIITKFIKKDILNSSIVDAGCGFGEYYNYIMKNIENIENYTGIDCEQNMINICKKRFPNTQFLVKNILLDNLSISDYYVCSGALNILTLKEVYIFIEKCFIASKKGFIFNFLKLKSYNNIQSNDIINFCKKYTQHIKIEENYLHNDLTIFMKHTY